MESSQGSYRGPLPPGDDSLCRLAAELRRDVVRLAEDIGERNVLRRPRQLALAADYIESSLVETRYEVKRQQYRVAGVSCCNLEAEILGCERPEEIVLFGAHYDSVSESPGANDNGSGVAALLTLARCFAGRRGRCTLRFVAFVNEEPPYFQTPEMGSWVYARHCRERGEKVTAMLSLETIGFYTDAPGTQQYPQQFSLPSGESPPATGNFIGFIGNERSGELLDRVLGLFRRYELFPSEGAVLPEEVPGVSFSDHWSFWQEGYPALMVTDTAMFRYPHYHEPTDTPDKICFEAMARVVRGLSRVAAVLAGPIEGAMTNPDDSRTSR